MSEAQFEGSHDAAARYLAVPRTLNTVGDNYQLPVLPVTDPQGLKGARVLIMSADGPELPELDMPLRFLQARGAEVKLAGQDWIFTWREPKAHIVVAQWLSDSICVKADLKLSEVKVEDYDCVYVPGGAWNPDMLRGDGTALSILRQAHKKGLLVASICHGPQVLISAAFDAPEGEENFPSKGVELTGVGSIIRDLKNAGFTVLDQETVYDAGANLLTSRNPKDLGPFCLELERLLGLRLAARK